MGRESLDFVRFVQLFAHLVGRAMRSNRGKLALDIVRTGLESETHRTNNFRDQSAVSLVSANGDHFRSLGDM